MVTFVFKFWEISNILETVQDSHNYSWRCEYCMWNPVWFMYDVWY